MQGCVESLENKLSAKDSRIAELESAHPPPTIELGLGDSAHHSDTPTERDGIHEHHGAGLRQTALTLVALL